MATASAALIVARQQHAALEEHVVADVVPDDARVERGEARRQRLPVARLVEAQGQLERVVGGNLVGVGLDGAPGERGGVGVVVQLAVRDVGGALERARGAAAAPW